MRTEPSGPGGSLNRTSVGLKPSDIRSQRRLAYQPQSNQRGIETQHRGSRPRQRGCCLNRTSVGLKLLQHHESEASQVRLNRTSVGLKLQMMMELRYQPTRLNRTSVGLKRSNKGCQDKPPI